MPYPWWLHKTHTPSKGTRDRVLVAMQRIERDATALEIACEAGIRHERVCRALDRLLIDGVVEAEAGRYRKAVKETVTQ